MNEIKEKIVVVGYGWIGQANALSLVKMGYEVFFYDPVEFPDLHYTEEMEHYARVKRTTSLEEHDSTETWFIVCVGDRVSEERIQDISLVKKACDSLKELKGKTILRSTILPQKLCELTFDMYLPEFLHEKNAVDECLNPYYFVVGTRTEISLPGFLEEWKRRSYKSFFGTPEEASYIKYLSNLWNTIRIAFVNEMGDSIGDPKNAEEVRRIERVLDFVLERKSYLRYGQGFDGHCLPKDTRAFIGAHAKDGKNVDMLVGAYSSNEHHKMLQEKYKSLPKVFSFWDNAKLNKDGYEALMAMINSIGLVQSLRKQLRFVVDDIAKVMPARTVQEAAALWEAKARENALYYSNTRTKSGTAVTEEEFKESGKSDYENIVLRDHTLGALLAKGTLPRALDFGSGIGRMSPYFKDNFDEVHGLDVSPTMIETAQARTGKDVSYATFDGSIIPYADEYFDFIFSYQTLQHVPSKADIERYLREFYRVLRSGGMVKIQLRSGRSVKPWEWSYGVSFTPHEAISMAEQVGFTVLDHQVDGIKHLWLILTK